MAFSLTTFKNKLLVTVILLLAFVDAQQSDYEDNYLSFNYGDNFLTKNNTKIIAQIGGTALLPCSVKLSSVPATVSWIRRNDMTLLTFGLSTYISDDRFHVEHVRHMGHWALRIKNVRAEDEGIYECQLSVHPVESIFVEVSVVEAIAEISGSPDIHIDEGSTLRLECKLKRATENPSYVFWYHNNKMVNYDTEAGYEVEIFVAPSSHPASYSSSLFPSDKNDLLYESLTTPLDSKSLMLDDEQQYSQYQQQDFSSSLLPTATSVLTIREAQFKHAGNYTCVPSNTKSTSVNVHVLRGEKPAAMQHANRSTIDITKSDSNKLIIKPINCTIFHLVIAIMNYFYQINR